MRGLDREWMDDEREDRRRRRRQVKLQEERTAAAHPGGKVTRGSGSSQTTSHKSDSAGDYFRAEDKQSTKHDTLSIDVSWLLKIKHEARTTGRKPMLTFGFAPKGKRRTREDWAAFPQSLASHMMNACAKLLEGDVQEATELAELALGKKALL